MRPSPRRPGSIPGGLHYNPAFVTPAERAEILTWLGQLHPIWEQRYSANNPPPAGKEQRWLLRPVYWLGNWQFACLNYYHPPKGIKNRCVAAEQFPPVLARLVAKVEAIARGMYRGADMPEKWHLNTCLVNYYGSRQENEKRIDTARVGEHKDFEPGPVASISLGERAFFQFISSRRPGTRDEVVFQQWLGDCSLQIFGGERWKNRYFHRVQRVERKAGEKFELHTENFETRRINFTFRYVPDEHIVPFCKLPPGPRDDVRGYIIQLARHSDFFASALSAQG
ncbi:MAG: alpha-ketoglutarate-dependent dioxygenase AlkB [Deltaproteobacteria bacterium]|nr:alpha-ketoglutarate-dependent dioxygenase AlkB [Deltaproteobacteria bacterium]